MSRVNKAITSPTKETTHGEDRSRSEQAIMKTKYKAVFGAFACFLFCLYFPLFSDNFKEDLVVLII